MKQAGYAAFHVASPEAMEEIPNYFSPKRIVLPPSRCRYGVHMTAEHQAGWMAIVGDDVKAPTLNRLSHHLKIPQLLQVVSDVIPHLALIDFCIDITWDRNEF